MGFIYIETARYTNGVFDSVTPGRSEIIDPEGDFVLPLGQPTGNGTFGISGVVTIQGVMMPTTNRLVGFSPSTFVYRPENVQSFDWPLILPPVVEQPYGFCFGAGTAIATPKGPRAVETIEPGMKVSTQDGRSVEVLWRGEQTWLRFFLTGGRRLVRIKAGALGAGLPQRDLRITGDHALCLAGVLVNACALVNGTSIVWDRPTAEEAQRPVTVYHLETEAHEVLVAEGVGAESLVNYHTRARLDNHAAYLARFGGERVIPEMPMTRITTARQLPPALQASLGLEQERAPVAMAG